MQTPSENLAELQLISNHTESDKINLHNFDLPKNYSILINKLEQLALGLDSAFASTSLERQEFDVTSISKDINGLAGGTDATESEFIEDILGGSVSAHTPTIIHGTSFRGLSEAEYSRVVSDIWIGVILTLLIVSVIFFICSCFLYHKFQQWKNSYHANPNEPVEICRHYTSDFEAESLPSYTIVSGLPTYDDALEEFRKAGIILTPPALPVIKVFEASSKDSQLYNMESGFNEPLPVGSIPPSSSTATAGGDNISLSSTCTCGGGSANTPNNSTTSLRSGLSVAPGAQIIELTPEQLAALSHKRLSLQIAFNNTAAIRRNSRPRVDLYRAVNRNNMLRSYVAAGNVSHNPGNSTANTLMMDNILPPIHRSCSSSSICSIDRNFVGQSIRQYQLQHRGSLF